MSFLCLKDPYIESLFDKSNGGLILQKRTGYCQYNIDYLKGEVLPLLRVGAANVGQAINALQK